MKPHIKPQPHDMHYTIADLRHTVHPHCALVVLFGFSVEINKIHEQMFVTGLYCLK